MFFCLETKEPKIQGSNFLCYKLYVLAKRFELASLKQQIVLNAKTYNLLNATKFKAELHSNPENSNVINR
ncbi:hypothetical protein AM493_15885 [Flavobacterium akiainvivens]|uniref:Uncharacterized protein n=1 Tax=Flavobacterium akiainvivens TaxID=1202724 RepID=A0A0M8MCK3_9FLAO|nr:hypothetical protein AM493_15885 [Flavobacterium akiainvivens]SFQ47089.1 hypothetical protein SAMN05444144_105158 [Flavobacterium akiainvivens]